MGNINDLPPPGSQEYLHWLKLKERHGPLSSVTILGQTLVIIHDRDIALELMEKRASKHSGRPNMKFAMEMWAPLPNHHSTLRDNLTDIQKGADKANF